MFEKYSQSISVCYVTSNFSMLEVGALLSTPMIFSTSCGHRGFASRSERVPAGGKRRAVETMGDCWHAG